MDPIFGNKDFYDPYTKCCGEVPRNIVYPDIALTVEIDGDELIISPVITGYAEEVFVITYSVNGEAIDTQEITANGTYPKTFDIESSWLESGTIKVNTSVNRKCGTRVLCKKSSTVIINIEFPSLQLTAEFDETFENLIISPTVGTGTYGSYNLYYYVNDVLVGSDVITEAGDYPLTIPTEEEWLTGDLVVSVKIESISPLPNYELTVSTLVIIPCGSVMPAGDVVLELTQEEYLLWSNSGKWRADYSVSGKEEYPPTPTGDLWTYPPGTFVEIESEIGCVFDDTFTPFPTTVNYYPGGPIIVSYTDLGLTIELGIVDGVYYAGITASLNSPGGLIADSGSTPGNGLGSVVLNIGGHIIPIQMRWNLSYSGNPGYTNDILFTLNLVRTSL